MDRNERPTPEAAELSPEELEHESAAELPDREALSVVYPDPATTMVPEIEQAAPGTPPGEPLYTILPVEEEPI